MTLNYTYSNSSTLIHTSVRIMVITLITATIQHVIMKYCQIQLISKNCFIWLTVCTRYGSIFV